MQLKKLWYVNASRSSNLVASIYVQRLLIKDVLVDSDHEQPIESVVDMLIKRTEGALEVLSYIQRGDKYIAEGNYEKAIVQYEMAIYYDPDNPYHYRHKAECFIGMESYDEAVEVALKAVKLDPYYPGSYLRLAEAYLGKGADKDGFAAFQEAIKLRPNSPITHLRFGQALLLYGDQGNVEQAVEEFRYAMRNDEQVDEIQARYLRYIGQAWAQFEDFPAAIKAYQQALALDPGNRDMRWDLRFARNKLHHTREN